MKITLRELHASYGQLSLLCSQRIPKGNARLAYRLGKIKSAADTEMNLVNAALKSLSLDHGFYTGNALLGPQMKDGSELRHDVFEAYEKDTQDFLSQQIDLPGEPFDLQTLDAVFDLSPEMCARLSWLIVFDQKDVPNYEPTGMGSMRVN